MKISTKGRYGLRIMLDLALAPKDEFVSIFRKNTWNKL